MNVRKLFSMQKELDKHIEENHGLQSRDLQTEKILALMVEIGELANETRCFKFWSLKPPASKEKILEEFVDGIHFILSLGIELGFEQNVMIESWATEAATVTNQFIRIYSQINKLNESKSIDDYNNLFNAYLMLGKTLGFTQLDIEQAYIQKNEVNYNRQENGY